MNNKNQPRNMEHELFFDGDDLYLDRESLEPSWQKLYENNHMVRPHRGRDYFSLACLVYLFKKEEIQRNLARAKFLDDPCGDDSIDPDWVHGDYLPPDFMEFFKNFHAALFLRLITLTPYPEDELENLRRFRLMQQILADKKRANAKEKEQA